MQKIVALFFGTILLTFGQVRADEESGGDEIICRYETRRESKIEAKRLSEKIGKQIPNASTLEEIDRLQTSLIRLNNCMNSVSWSEIGGDSISPREIRSDPARLEAMINDRRFLLSLPIEREDLETECNAGRIPDAIGEGDLEDDEIPSVRLELFLDGLNHMEYFLDDPEVLDAKKEFGSGDLYKSCACRSSAYLEMWHDSVRNWSSPPGKSELEDRKAKLEKYRAICAGKHPQETVASAPPKKIEEAKEEAPIAYTYDLRSKIGKGAVGVSLQNCTSPEKVPYIIWAYGGELHAGTKLGFVLAKAVEMSPELCAFLQATKYSAVVFGIEGDFPKTVPFAFQGRPPTASILRVELTEKEINPDLSLQAFFSWLQTGVPQKREFESSKESDPGLHATLD